MLEVPEHPPTTGLLLGSFLLESEEKVVVWLFVMEGSFDGGKRNPRSWAGPDSEPQCPGSSAVLTFLHCAVAPTL